MTQTVDNQETTVWSGAFAMAETAARPRKRARASLRAPAFASRFEELLARADIAVGGDRPWDIRVHDRRLPAKVLAGGTLGLGEAYMDGGWECGAIDELCARAIAAGVDRGLGSVREAVDVAWARIRNLQSVRRAIPSPRRPRCPSPHASARRGRGRSRGLS